MGTVNFFVNQSRLVESEHVYQGNDRPDVSEFESSSLFWDRSEGKLYKVSGGAWVDAGINGAVDSVAGKTGVVTLEEADITDLGSYLESISTSNVLSVNGATVKLVYRNGNSRWELPDGTVPTLTGRNASILWEGTSSQIPAQGSGDAEFQVGDTAFVRASTL